MFKSIKPNIDIILVLLIPVLRSYVEEHLISVKIDI